MTQRSLLILLLLSLLIVACSGATPAPATEPDVQGTRGIPDTPEPQETQETSEPQGTVEGAREALIRYYSLLNQGAYTEAVDYYGGDFEILTSYNPDIPPYQHVTLLRGACERQFICMEIRDVISEEELSPTSWRFVVEFANDDGSLFQQMADGGSDTDAAWVSRYTYTVRYVDGRYLIDELPVYVP